MVKSKNFNCPVEAAISVMGGRWKPLLLWWLHSKGVLRFSELRRLLPGVSEKVLAQQLREMEADGLVHRHAYPTVPPKVEYSLTEYGKTLKRALNALCAWGEAHMQRNP